jgi:hypothetical protein
MSSQETQAAGSTFFDGSSEHLGPNAAAAYLLQPLHYNRGFTVHFVDELADTAAFTPANPGNHGIV